jgi:hypothetical protein
VITADQLVCHGIGDYVLQSDWMAGEKTKRSVACAAHVVTYALPFLVLRPSLAALAVIVGSHFVIDRWRLARFVCWIKNIVLCPPSWETARGNGGRQSAWINCNVTGYPSERPPWLSVWLLIIADNLMHVVINGAALRYLP